VANFVPGTATKIVTVYMQQFAQKASRLTALGTVLLAFTSILLMLTIDRVFNRIWHVRRQRPLVARLMVYWAVLTVGPLLVGVSLYASTWLLGKAASGIPGPGAWLYRGFTIVLTCAALTFLYRTVPNRRVQTLDAAIGGIAAGLVFEAMKTGFATLVGNFANYQLVYGAFAGLPVFLLWIYLSWVVVLAGAVVVASMPFLHVRGWKTKRVPGSAFVEALHLLSLLRRTQERGGVSSLATLSRDARLAPDDVEALLDRMRRHGWVARSAGAGWLLARDPRTLPVADVWHEFAFRGDALRKEARAAGIGAFVERLAHGMRREADLSLEDALALPRDATSAAPEQPGEQAGR
ncbi:MAG: YihY family inner membrane protein, partial [Burkholderiales bacterium]|nr:YihY family inner membrane protein [Burkholderiales bacterium]